jgi:hypothetical protein
MADRSFKIGEVVIEGKRLGRHVEHDPRSFNFAAEAPPARILHTVHHKVGAGLAFDQGHVGSCTANALFGAIMSAPYKPKVQYSETDALALYHDETVLQGDPYPPNDTGGSGLMVCKAAVAKGLIKGYLHAFSLQDALAALQKRPLITGINWYSSFDQPDRKGMVAIAPNAFVRGGHEIAVTGMSVHNRTVTFLNSWGPGWGVKGEFKMSWEDWDRLLHEEGDVTVPLPK